jgi:hypothetical protein
MAYILYQGKTHIPALLNKTSGKKTMELIDIKKIDPSPLQHRKLMSADKLRELAASIMREGLIEPVVLRGVFRLYAGKEGSGLLRNIQISNPYSQGSLRQMTLKQGACVLQKTCNVKIYQ